MSLSKETDLKEKFENQLNFSAKTLVVDKTKAEEFKEKGNEEFKSKLMLGIFHSIQKIKIRNLANTQCKRFSGPVYTRSSNILPFIFKNHRKLKNIVK
jgi:hypothetical protein